MTKSEGPQESPPPPIPAIIPEWSLYNTYSNKYWNLLHIMLSLKGDNGTDIIKKYMCGLHNWPQTSQYLSKISQSITTRSPNKYIANLPIIIQIHPIAHLLLNQLNLSDVYFRERDLSCIEAYFQNTGYTRFAK